MQAFQCVLYWIMQISLAHCDRVYIPLETRNSTFRRARAAITSMSHACGAESCAESYSDPCQHSTSDNNAIVRQIQLSIIEHCSMNRSRLAKLSILFSPAN